MAVSSIELPILQSLNIEMSVISSLYLFLISTHSKITYIRSEAIESTRQDRQWKKFGSDRK
ncbi:hypothetical protein [Chroococcidiopsis sp.]|uniref:hypothetical protein n=1 Tax=Chroococcidiopsis sp. TaxID=3088168 RepID=UPI003F66FA76